MYEIRMPPTVIHNVIMLETIPEEELTCSDLSEESHGEDVTKSNSKDECVQELEDTLSIVEDSYAIDDLSGDDSEEQPNERLEESFQEEVVANISGWIEAFNWDDFAYNLIIGFLPTAWNVFSDLGIASYLKENAEVDSAGLREAPL